MNLYQNVSFLCSRAVTNTYSTSFSLAVTLLGKDIRQDVYNIYGFVRLADEIVDSFHEFDKESLLSQFKAQTFQAIRDKISLNPILNSFQESVNKYQIDLDLITAFFKSMEMDLVHSTYDFNLRDKYIYGSAEVVGLMCLKVFLKGRSTPYDRLEKSARALGAAFQKINFLRDLKQDLIIGRVYFVENFSREEKIKIEREIEIDLTVAYAGLKELPLNARTGVTTAYHYYLQLFEEIKKTSPETLYSRRIRISNYTKYMILAKTLLLSSFRRI